MLGIKLINRNNKPVNVTGYNAEGFKDLVAVPYVKLGRTYSYGGDYAEALEALEGRTRIISLNEMIAELTGAETGAVPGKGQYIVTSDDGTYGAACILTKKAKRRLAEIFPEGYIILPSSIHEVIAVSVTEISEEDARTMVSEVNDTRVAPEDRLSYNVYRF